VVEQLNASGEGNLDKLLIRQVHAYQYNVQYWMEGERDFDAVQLLLEVPKEKRLSL
jgi:hypothetical protein